MTGAWLNGKYNCVAFGSDHATQFSSGIGYLNFDGAGNYTGEILQVSHGQPDEDAFDVGTISGVYSIEPNGKITLGEYDSGFVSADGSLLVWVPIPGDTPYEETGISIGIKAPLAEELPSDYFNNNIKSDMWQLYEEDADNCWLEETNQQLEVRATANANGVGAGYDSFGWRLDPADDFSLRVDFQYNPVKLFCQ